MRIILFLLFLSACSSAPITGRKQLKLMPESTLRSQSAVAYKEVLAKSKIENHSEDARRVKRVGQRIKAAVESYFKSQGKSEIIKNYQWEFNLINENTVNAWAMAGGKVAFYNGIMPICETDAGVAVVMGHEIAHAIAGHSNEGISRALIQQFSLVALDAALSKITKKNVKDAVLASVGVGSSLLLLKYGRNQESEADEMGLVFMAIAGYDPHEAPRFWQRMQAQDKGHTPEWLSTHPSNERRIRDLQAKIPKAMTYFHSSN